MSEQEFLETAPDEEWAEDMAVNEAEIASLNEQWAAISAPEEEPRPDVQQPIMSGHCATPSDGSHDRCARNGAGNRANPKKHWHPCPCACHLGDLYECGNCGRTIAEAPRWDGTGEMSYVHIEEDTGRGIGEDCG